MTGSQQQVGGPGLMHACRQGSSGVSDQPGQPLLCWHVVRTWDSKLMPTPRVVLRALQVL